MEDAQVIWILSDSYNSVEKNSWILGRVEVRPEEPTENFEYMVHHSVVNDQVTRHLSLTLVFEYSSFLVLEYLGILVFGYSNFQYLSFLVLKFSNTRTFQ